MGSATIKPHCGSQSKYHLPRGQARPRSPGLHRSADLVRGLGVCFFDKLALTGIGYSSISIQKSLIEIPYPIEFVKGILHVEHVAGFLRQACSKADFALR